MAERSSPNGVVPPALAPHIGHVFHPHRHVRAEKDNRVCSGRWWCETDKTWIDGPKCEMR